MNYFFICAYCWLFYYKQFIFLIAILVKRSSSWILWQISHLWNSLNLCGESKYHNRYICHPFIHSFWMFKVIKRSIFIAFIVIQVIDDRIYFDLPSVQNVNSNNYFRCLYEWAVLFHWTQYTNRHLLIVCRQRSFSGLLCVYLCW